MSFLILGNFCFKERTPFHSAFIKFLIKQNLILSTGKHFFSINQVLTCENFSLWNQGLSKWQLFLWVMIPLLCCYIRRENRISHELWSFRTDNFASLTLLPCLLACLLPMFSHPRCGDVPWGDVCGPILMFLPTHGPSKCSVIRVLGCHPGVWLVWQHAGPIRTHLFVFFSISRNSVEPICTPPAGVLSWCYQALVGT
jgi:hypothetical protein